MYAAWIGFRRGMRGGVCLVVWWRGLVGGASSLREWWILSGSWVGISGWGMLWGWRGNGEDVINEVGGRGFKGWSISSELL